MTKRGTLSKEIELTNCKAIYDSACKSLLSAKIVLAQIMRSCLDEYRSIETDIIASQCIERHPFVAEVPLEPNATGAFLQNQGQESASSTEGNIYYDIYFNASVPQADDIIQLIINMEAQKVFYPGYPLLKRAVYYCARMLSAQKNTVFSDSQYDKLRKVYSVWICLKPPKRLENTITKFHTVQTNIIGNVEEKPGNYDLQTIIMLCLGSLDSPDSKGILRFLSVLFSNELRVDEKKLILEKEYSLAMTQNMQEKAKRMFNFSDVLVEESEARGEARGKAIGLENGILTSLKNLMANMNLTVQEAMKALGIPEEDRPRYLEKLASERQTQ